MIGPSPGRRGHDRGSALPLAVAVLAWVSVVAAAALVVTTYVVAVGQMRGAADLVAVSAADAFRLGADPCSQARRTAEANRVQLAGCRRSGSLLDFTVEVEVTRAVPVRAPGLPHQITAVAAAGRGDR